MSDVVLDASAIIAVIRHEPGRDHVAALVETARVSALNVAEVATWLSLRGASTADVYRMLGQLEFAIEPFDGARALAAGVLVPKTRSRGLSLADRACLALAVELGLPVVTADRAWAALELGVEVRLIR